MSIEAMKQALDNFDKLPYFEAVKQLRTALRQAIEEAEKQEPDLPPVEIGVDVTEHGATVVAFYRRPNAVMEMFYSQFHPQPKQAKNPPIRIQNHAHTDHPMRHWDRTCLACVAEAEKQEPVAWVVRRTTSGGDVLDGVWTCDSDEDGAMPVYTAPPRKEWVGLTDDDLRQIILASIGVAEAKLKEKNGG